MLRRRLHGLVEDKSKPEIVRRCAVVLRELARHKLSGVFLFPMDRLQVPEYYEVIEHPITVLSLLEHLERWSPVGGTGAERVGGEAAGEAELLDGFTISVRRMWENCWSYNHEGTEVSLCVPYVIQDTTPRRTFSKAPFFFFSRHGACQYLSIHRRKGIDR